MGTASKKPGPKQKKDAGESKRAGATESEHTYFPTRAEKLAIGKSKEVKGLIVEGDYGEARRLARTLNITFDGAASNACREQIIAHQFGSSKEIANEFRIPDREYRDMALDACIRELMDARDSKSSAVTKAHVDNAKAIKSGTSLDSGVVMHQLKRMGLSELCLVVLAFD